MDNLTRDQRSKNMAKIKSKDTKPEIKVRSFLHNSGLRFRLNNKDLPGRPDIVLNKYKTVIFVDGCFWHRHRNCKYAYNPKSRVEFWEKKFRDNVKRDLKVNKQYSKIDWNQIRIWECEVNNDNLIKIVKNIKSY